MFKVFIRRLTGLVPLFFGIILMSFFVVRLAPGGPADERFELNPKAAPDARARFEKIYGLDKPLPEQFLAWTGRVTRLDFGESFVDGESAFRKISRALPVTLLISGLSLLVICVLGTWVGVTSAVHESGILDRTLTTMTLAGFSLPTFWIALLAMSFFGVQLKVLPVSGLTSVFFDAMSLSGKIMDLASHLVLPVAVSSLTGLAGFSRLARNSMIEVLKQDYLRTARAKGLPESKVLYVHALKNAALPVVTALGLSVPGLLGGSVVFETIFSMPGMGRLFFNSVFSRDYPVILGILVLGALATLIGNLLADLACAAADPRIRLR